MRDARAEEVENLLHWAAEYGHHAVVELLLANEADPNIRNMHGKTPLDWMPQLAEIVKEVAAEKAGKKQPAQAKVETP